MDNLLSAVRTLHSDLVFGRRIRVLAASIGALVPSGSSVLDIGCGDGQVAHLIQQADPTIHIQGLEFKARPGCLIDCRTFDGVHIPAPDASTDVCMFVDVLHHTQHPTGLLREARRVARKHILVKDHLCENEIDFAILRLMDWVGNRPHGVVLPYIYQTNNQWQKSFTECGLMVTAWTDHVPLYPFPFSHIFERKLHFVALLEKAAV